MALAATTILEVEVGGSDSGSGGGFDPANSSMSTDLAATSANTASPVVTSASCNFVTRHNSTYLFIQSGTNWVPGWYPVVSTSGNAATLNAAIGAVVLYNGQTMTNTVAGCATVASPTAGKWSIDYSRQTTAVSLTMAIDATTNTKFTSTPAVGPDFVGNLIAVTAGTGFTVQRVQVSSVTGTTATCDKSLGTLSSTGGSGGLGGAFAGPVAAFGILPNGAGIMVKYSATPYTITGTTINLQQLSYIVGYDTTRHFFNTDANLPIFRAGANSTRFVYTGSNYVTVRNIQFDNPSGTFTSVTGFQQDGSACIADRCKFLNLATGFSATGPFGSAINCYAESCTVGFQSATTSTRIACVAKSCGAGFGNSTVPDDSKIINCINIGSTANSTACFFGGARTVIMGCVAYNPTGTSVNGFQLTGAPSLCVNNIAMGCTQYGYSMNGSPNISTTFRNNAGYNNTTANINTADINANLSAGFVTLTGNPFTNASGGDFSLNTTAGAGAACVRAGFPNSYFGISTNNYPNIGVSQYGASGGAVSGGVPHLAGRGGGLAG